MTSKFACSWSDQDVAFLFAEDNQVCDEHVANVAGREQYVSGRMIVFRPLSKAGAYLVALFGALLESALPRNANLRVMVVSALLFYLLQKLFVFTHMVVYPLFRLLFGTLYPAYASYKAIKSKNIKEYVKWMMYWIVFALFSCTETVTDVFFNWLPFYYEIKIILVVWLLSPATRGSSFLYRKFVHPMLSSREQEIDEYISKAKEQGYKQVMHMGSKGVTVLMQTALKSGGGIVNQIRKSYSLSDLTDRLHGMGEICSGDDIDGLDRLVSPHRRKRHTTLSSASRSSLQSTSAMYFAEIEVRADALSSVNPADDISSGYYSNEALLASQAAKLQQSREALPRAGSLKARPTRVTRSSAVPSLRKAATTDVSNLSGITPPGAINATFCQEAQDSHSSSGIDADVDDAARGRLGEASVLATNGKQEVRGGKYHKKHAPQPPKAITATLVLQPGVIQPIGDEEVFCNWPKMARRAGKSPRSRSRSKTRSRSVSRSRSSSPSSKMLRAS